jgi:hypothetical protein
MRGSVIKLLCALAVVALLIHVIGNSVEEHKRLSKYNYVVTQYVGNNSQTYYINSYVQKNNGCISFQLSDGEQVVCGNFTIRQQSQR